MKMTPKKGQADHKLKPSKVAVYDLPGPFWGQNLVDHKLKPEMLISAEWEG